VAVTLYNVQRFLHASEIGQWNLHAGLPAVVVIDFLRAVEFCDCRCQTSSSSFCKMHQLR